MYHLNWYTMFSLKLIKMAFKQVKWPLWEVTPRWCSNNFYGKFRFKRVFQRICSAEKKSWSTLRLKLSRFKWWFIPSSIWLLFSTFTLAFARPWNDDNGIHLPSAVHQTKSIFAAGPVPNIIKILVTSRIVSYIPTYL